MPGTAHTLERLGYCVKHNYVCAISRHVTDTVRIRVHVAMVVDRWTVEAQLCLSKKDFFSSTEVYLLLVEAHILPREAQLCLLEREMSNSSRVPLHPHEQ